MDPGRIHRAAACRLQRRLGHERKPRQHLRPVRWRRTVQQGIALAPGASTGPAHVAGVGRDPAIAQPLRDAPASARWSLDPSAYARTHPAQPQVTARSRPRDCCSRVTPRAVQTRAWRPTRHGSLAPHPRSRPQPCSPPATRAPSALSAPSGSGSTRSSTQMHNDAVSAARCMRANGVPSFPDPTNPLGGRGSISWFAAPLQPRPATRDAPHGFPNGTLGHAFVLGACHPRWRTPADVRIH